MNRSELRRGGFTLMEALVGGALGLLVVGMVVEMFAKGSRQVQGLLTVEDGLRALNVARMALGKDLITRPSTGSLELSPTVLTLQIPAGMDAMGNVQLRPTQYRLDGAPGEVFLFRQGEILAGPFQDGYFEMPGPEPALRVVLTPRSSPTAVPTVLTIQAPLAPNSEFLGLDAAFQEVVP